MKPEYKLGDKVFYKGSLWEIYYIAGQEFGRKHTYMALRRWAGNRETSKGSIRVDDVIPFHKMDIRAAYARYHNNIVNILKELNGE